MRIAPTGIFLGPLLSGKLGGKSDIMIQDDFRNETFIVIFKVHHHCEELTTTICVRNTKEVTFFWMPIEVNECHR